MRRVELKSSPGKPYWYVDATTDFDAIGKIARVARKPHDQYRVVR